MAKLCTMGESINYVNRQYEQIPGGMTMDSEVVKDKVLSFFQNYIPYDESINEIDGDESLIENGCIDSTGLISLIAFIEENFRFEVHDREIIPENFESINKINMYINSRISSMR